MTLPFVSETPIRGLQIIEMDLRPDERGWFVESWNKSKLGQLELASFQPQQQNISFNLKKGTLRGLHAEPWDKLVTVASGEVFCAWVDLRPGDGFGKVASAVLKPGFGAFIPSGIANGYQTLRDDTSYVYLVNAHWSAGVKYKAIDPFDSELNISWPFPKNSSILSEKDWANPALSELTSDAGYSGYIFGANGQLGREITRSFPGLRALHRSDADVSSLQQVADVAIQPSDIVINAAAYTAVDAAETPAGTARAFEANVLGVQNLANACSVAGATLIHFSTDYVFDGAKQGPNRPTDLPRPLNVYGLSKSAGESIARSNPKTYIVRTSWVFGDGSNFVKSIFLAAHERKEIRVVRDQFGRPTSTVRLSQATKFLIDQNLPFGIYHVTDAGPLVSRFELAVFIYEQLEVPNRYVTPVTSSETALKSTAQRPLNSDLGDQIGHLGNPDPWQLTIRHYLKCLLEQEKEKHV